MLMRVRLGFGGKGRRGNEGGREGGGLWREDAEEDGF